MPLGRTAVVACGGLALHLLFVRPCAAQGAATRLEVEAAEHAVVILGRSAVVRGILTKVLGPGNAEAILSLPPKELGWEIVGNDRVVSALAESSHIGRPGNSDEFIASINSLRTFRALTGSEARSSNLTLLSSSDLKGHQFTLHDMKIEPTTLSGATRTDSELSLATRGSATRSYDFSMEGLQIDPAFKVPIWKSAKSTGSLQLGAIKRNDTFAAIAVGCAFITKCNNQIYAPIQKFVAAPSPAKTPSESGSATKTE